MGRIRAVGIVINDKKLLVVERHNSGNDYYVFPGGGVEPGETPEEAVIREVSEEASLDVTLGPLLYKINYNDDGTTQYFFVCNYTQGEPQIRPDSPEAKKNVIGEDLYRPMWLALSQLPSTLLYPLEVRDWLLDDLKNGLPEGYKEFDLIASERRQTLGD